MKTERGLNLIRHWWGRLFRRGNPQGDVAAAVSAELGPYGKTFEAGALELPYDCDYPSFMSMGEFGLAAYRASFLVAVQKVVLLLEALEAHYFHNASHGDSDWQLFESQTGEKVLLLVQPFRLESSVLLLTNSAAFIAALKSLDLSPPTPWDVLQELNPETLGALQGDAEFYWDHYWQPFWSTRCAEQQQEFLAQAPVGWRDYMQFRG